MPQQHWQQWEPTAKQPEFTVARTGTIIYGFVFRADLHYLDGLCRRYLNLEPTGRVSYEPLAPVVLLQFLAPNVKRQDIDRGVQLGRYDESELSVCVPVRRRGAAGPMFFIPYSFNSDPRATVEARELFGLPAEISQLNQQEWPGKFRVAAFKMEEFGEKAVGDWGDVLYVTRGGKAKEHELHCNDFAHAALRLQRRLIREAAYAAPGVTPLTLGAFWPPNGAMVQLKQFPDCVDGGKACYTSIVELQSRVALLPDPPLVVYDKGSRYNLEIPKAASHPLAMDIGLQTGQKPLLGYRMSCSVTLGEAREIWRAPIEMVSPSPTLAETLCDLALQPARKIFDFGARAVGLIESILIPPPKPPSGRRRVQPLAEGNIAILGGGIGALTAAFELSKPGLRERFKEITVYQIGWRLGGKGASGRNARAEQRIEEHGLHGWFGFYDNAFGMMRECYRELDDKGELAPPLSPTPSGAKPDPIHWGFEKQRQTCLEEWDGQTWRPHWIDLPDVGGLPGDGVSPTVIDFVGSFLEWVSKSIPKSDAIPASFPDASEAETLAETFTLLADEDERWLEHKGGNVDNLIDAAERLNRFGQGAPLIADFDLKHRLLLLQLAGVILKGLAHDVYLHGGDFDRVDEEVVGWLRRHGASEEALRSDYVRLLHAMSFAYHGGQAGAPATSAGPAIRALLRMVFTYRGAFLWKMKAGMGDIVFAPLYRLLEKRGVKFKFFHRVDKMKLSADKKAIQTIELGIQATPSQDYPFLRDVKGLKCWPNSHSLDHLAEVDKIKDVEKAGIKVDFESAWSPWGPDKDSGKLTLERGQQFDHVVLGISLGALGSICPELIQTDEGWRAMVEGVKTIRTQSFQLWFTKTLSQAGFTHPTDPDPRPFMTTFVRPIETWGDFTHTLAKEEHKIPVPPEEPAAQVGYFCGPMPDTPPSPEPYTHPEFPKQMQAKVFEEVKRYVVDGDRPPLKYLMPKLYNPGTGKFDYGSLYAAPEKRDEERLEAQHYRANINPSDRYVLCTPGTISRRLRSDESGFDNLALAGDWTFNGLNLGCIEAAVMSGKRAAQAIIGSGLKIVGETHLDGFHYLEDQTVMVGDLPECEDGTIGEEVVRG